MPWRAVKQLGDGSHVEKFGRRVIRRRRDSIHRVILRIEKVVASTLPAGWGDFHPTAKCRLTRNAESRKLLADKRVQEGTSTFDRTDSFKTSVLSVYSSPGLRS